MGSNKGSNEILIFKLILTQKVKRPFSIQFTYNSYSVRQLPSKYLSRINLHGKGILMPNINLK